MFLFQYQLYRYLKNEAGTVIALSGRNGSVIGGGGGCGCQVYIERIYDGIYITGGNINININMHTELSLRWSSKKE